MVVLPNGNPSIKEGEELMLPLKDVKVAVSIHESIALISMTQTFQNTGFDSTAGDDDPRNASIEVTYKFPKIKSAVVSNLKISIGDDRVIEAKIEEKKKAE